MGTGGCIYIMTNKRKTTVYIGVTSDLLTRITEHKEHKYPGSFTAKYNLEYCIYYEAFFRIEEAIAREKEVKKWCREKKDALINRLNPEWNDLYEEIRSW
jgi:putative endonuclease